MSERAEFVNRYECIQTQISMSHKVSHFILLQNISFIKHERLCVRVQK